MYLLRWRFDYLNRTTKIGQWSRGATLEQDMAYFQNKEGVIRAAIEGKHQVSREVRILAECDGHDFVNFQWMAEFRGNVKGGGSSHHTGLKLVTRDFWIEVYARGFQIKKPRTEEDKKFHYATFGR